MIRASFERLVLGRRLCGKLFSAVGTDIVPAMGAGSSVSLSGLNNLLCLLQLFLGTIAKTAFNMTPAFLVC